MASGPMHQSLLPYTPERDAYRLLGVPSTASSEEITAACRRLARTFHPDRNASVRATAEMQVVNTVRQLMSDPDRRAVYDRERHRFHTRALRPAGPGLVTPPVAPLRSTASGSEPWQVIRYVRAVLAGVRAAAHTLAPPRCRGCRAVIATGEDAYCAACGTPLLTGG
jgi:curved DNA-binding protein CbpA